MNHSDAVQLIQKGIKATGGTWADLGAGSGTFTRALAELLGPNGLIYAVDKNSGIMRIKVDVQSARVKPLQADFTKELELPALDGILMGNSLHYVSDKVAFLKGLLKHLRPGGQLILVEYDNEISNLWVPYPLSFRAFTKLAFLLELAAPKMLGRTASRHQPQDIYAAESKKEELEISASQNQQK
jgi:ubiquinone/menaquinone biosynthesis C-methylase UbiE